MSLGETKSDPLPNEERTCIRCGERFTAYTKETICCKCHKRKAETKVVTHFADKLVSDSRSCARCGDRFSTFGREYICPKCRAPKPCNRRTTEKPEHLSNREQQIVNLICRAKTNKEIAYDLCLTEGTVKEYLHHIFRKMKVSNRTELALSCHRDYASITAGA